MSSNQPEIRNNFSLAGDLIDLLQQKPLTRMSHVHDSRKKQ